MREYRTHPACRFNAGYGLLLDTLYILMDKHTQEIFFVYLKLDGLETLLDDYHHKSDYIEKGIIISCIISKNIKN